MFAAEIMFEDFQGLFQIVERLIVMSLFLQQNTEIILDLGHGRMRCSEERLGLFQRSEIQILRLGVIALFPVNI